MVLRAWPSLQSSCPARAAGRLDKLSSPRLEAPYMWASCEVSRAWWGRGDWAAAGTVTQGQGLAVDSRAKRQWQGPTGRRSVIAGDRDCVCTCVPGLCVCACLHVGTAHQCRPVCVCIRAPQVEPSGLGPWKTALQGVQWEELEQRGGDTWGSPWETNSLRTGSPLKSPQSPQVWLAYLVSSSSWYRGEDMSNAGLPGRQDGRRDGRRSQTSPGGGGAPQRGDQPWTLPTRSLEPRCEQGPAPEETPTPRGSSPSAEHVPPSLGAVLAAGAHLALPRPPTPCPRPAPSSPGDCHPGST